MSNVFSHHQGRLVSVNEALVATCHVPMFQLSLSTECNGVRVIEGVLPPTMGGSPSRTFDPSKDLVDLKGKVVIVTGGK